MYRELFEKWLSSDLLSDNNKKELLSIQDNDKEIEYRFGKNLEFGTAGMRGLIGLGTNMINEYTVKLATQGLSTFIKSLGKDAMAKGVVISYDTRKFSKEFALAAATVLVSNGIKTYMFDDVHPVPMLSFAVKHLKTIAGIMITASHNPKEYNGYKVYGADGAQMSPEDTAKVVEYINALSDPLSSEILYDTNKVSKIILLSKKTDKAYYKKIKKLSLSKKIVKAEGKNLKIVYTPVHGSGYIPVVTILKKLGISPIVVPEQTTKDSEYSTVKVPNPELAETLTLAIKMADFKNADVVFGTDPDCDRLGVAVRNDDGDFVVLSGNQTGILLLDYVLKRLKEEDKLSKKGFVVKSFVTTSMAKLIASDYGVELMEVPVGFKFIGEKIKLLDDTGKRKFLFGFEESCGYLRGTHARDKDAVVASMLFAEMTCYYMSKGESIYEVLQNLYEKYGYVYDLNESVAYSGLNAMRDMNAVVDKLKTVKIDSAGGLKIVATRDYSSSLRILPDGSTEDLNVSKNNAVYYELEGGGFICVRPSGTEPKLKIYYSLNAKNLESGKELFEKVKTDFSEYLK